MFDVHPGVLMAHQMRQGLLEKTGRKEEEWIALIQGEGLFSSREAVKWLKSEFKLGRNYAVMLWELSEGENLEQYDGQAYLDIAPTYIEYMFQGNKADLRLIWEEVYLFVRALGSDVKICPGRTIIPFYRETVFAQLKVSTENRIDLGLALGKSDSKVPAVAQRTGGLELGDRITHRLPMSKVEDFSDVAKDLVTEAYNLTIV